MPEPAPIRLDLHGSAYLPDAYIADSGAKLEAYRRFAAVRSEAHFAVRGAAPLAGIHAAAPRGEAPHGAAPREARPRAARDVRGPR